MNDSSLSMICTELSLHKDTNALFMKERRATLEAEGAELRLALIRRILLNRVHPLVEGRWKIRSRVLNEEQIDFCEFEITKGRHTHRFELAAYEGRKFEVIISRMSNGRSLGCLRLQKEVWLARTTAVSPSLD